MSIIIPKYSNNGDINTHLYPYITRFLQMKIDKKLKMDNIILNNYVNEYYPLIIISLLPKELYKSHSIPDRACVWSMDWRALISYSMNFDSSCKLVTKVFSSDISNLSFSLMGVFVVNA